MHDISEKELTLLLEKIPNYENTDLLIFSISLNQFEKQNIFFDRNQINSYQKEIERHISLISKSRYLKINEKEFLFIIKKKDTPIKTIEKRILSALYKPINIGDFSISIPYNIGSSRYPQDSKDIFKCIKFARVSKLYLAKDSLKHYAKYEKHRYEQAYEEFIIKNTLISAIEKDELEMYYQPIFNSDKTKIISFESLLRWEKNGIFISPQKIIENAEDTENIHILTEYIIEKVVKQLKLWKDTYKKIIPVSINISQSALTNPKLPWALNNILEKYNITSSYLKIEITETTSSKTYSSINYEKISPTQISDKLIKCGFDLYADDFGIGFSNLEFISSHGFKGIKIDKFFIDKIIGDESNFFLGLVKKVMELAEENGQIIICEGVETEKQLLLLKEMKIDFYVQGYLFSKPLPSKEIESKYYLD